MVVGSNPIQPVLACLDHGRAVDARSEDERYIGLDTNPLERADRN